MPDKPKNIYQRMTAVMKELKAVSKSDKLVNGQYGFVSHDATAGAIHPLIVKHGIHIATHVEEFKQDGNRTEVTLAVRFTNIDEPEDSFIVKSFGYGIDGQDKGPGKAISYALKYCLLKQFLLEAGEPDNENSHTEYKPVERAGSRLETPATSSDPARSLSDPIWFGKFKGKSWPEADAGYLGWLIKNPQGDGAGSKLAQEELDRRSGVVDGTVEDVKAQLAPAPPIGDDDDLPF
jgi:hypothetical protein